MVKIFQSILSEKSQWLRSKKGGEFEDRFETSLKQNGYNRLDKDDFQDVLDRVKSKVQSKKSNAFIENDLNQNELKKCFFWQPYGSQNYPDFLVFTDNYIVPVEIKYSSEKAVKPMWNSNLPKMNGFYIFGSYNNEDITFFNGRFVLEDKERDELIDFFEDNIKPLEEEFKNDIKHKIEEGVYEFKRGFNVYVRRAFEQNQVCNEKAELDYFNASDRKEVESKTLELLKTLE